MAIFERGAWPVLLPDGTALVYVPGVRGGRLVADSRRSVLPRAFRAHLSVQPDGSAAHEAVANAMRGRVAR